MTQHLSSKVIFILLLTVATLNSTNGPMNSTFAGITQVGVAKADITPSFPVILAGYGGRQGGHEGVDTSIWARAMAIGEEIPLVVVAVDNCGVPATIVEKVAARVATTTNLPRSHLVVCSTHTHTAPALTDYAVVLWGEFATEEQLADAAVYTNWLTDKLVEIALKAIENRQRAHLAFGQGIVTFGGNRRHVEKGVYRGFGFQQDGPVDHSLPVMVATNEAGDTLAVWTNYACHCTTLGSRNRIGGDWVGFANELIEQRFPTAISLTTIGCGADVKPEPEGSLEMAQRHGETIAKKIQKLVATGLQPISAVPRATMVRLQLPLAKIPDPSHWRGQLDNHPFHSFHAKLMLQRIAQDGKLAQHVEYPIITWTFGDQLAIVFLAGEVVVDYAIRLKHELDWQRLWINGWSNDVPSYIPSQRVLAEGGYEADFSQIYYALPSRYDPALEDIIVNQVKTMVGAEFATPASRKEFPLTRRPRR